MSSVGIPSRAPVWPLIHTWLGSTPVNLQGGSRCQRALKETSERGRNTPTFFVLKVELCILWLSMFVSYSSHQRCRCAGANGEVNYDLLGKILTAKSLEEVCACSFVRKRDVWGYFLYHLLLRTCCSRHVRCARRTSSFLLLPTYSIPCTFSCCLSIWAVYFHAITPCHVVCVYLVCCIPLPRYCVLLIWTPNMGSSWKWPVNRTPTGGESQCTASNWCTGL